MDENQKVYELHNETMILQNRLINDNIFLKKQFLNIENINIESYNVIKDLPKSFCWKNLDGKDYTTPAKDQGSIGACWAFAAIAAIESIIEIREDCPDLNPDLSEQYLHSCLPIIQEEYNVRPFFWIMNTSDDGNNWNGVITESCFPYEEKKYVPCSNKCSDWQDHLIPICNFSYWIPDKTPSENDEMMVSIQ